MWIETNCFLINRKLEELGIKTEDTPARMSFDHSEISSYREIMEGEEISKKECIVYMKSGDTFVVDMSYDNLKKKIQSYE